jgi:hypothetical protein
MRAKHFFAGIVVLIFLFSNLVVDGTVYAAAEQGKFQKETILIDGVGKEQTVGSEKNLVLIVTGANNRITVENGTNVTQISIGGTGNLIFIPFGQKPKVIQGGANNGVLHYG